MLHNSCGDRHCPQCAGAKRADWIDSTKMLLLDGVDYFQVVFTLPSELSSLALGNRRKIDDLLFASAWSALKQTIGQEQGYDPAALLMLHTWNQQLEAHGTCRRSGRRSSTRWQRLGEQSPRYFIGTRFVRTLLGRRNRSTALL